MNERQKIYWLDVNRFDVKPDKSTWLEMGNALSRAGFDVSIVTSYRREPYPVEFRGARVVSLPPSRLPAFFRIGFLIRAALLFVRIRDRGAIYILPPAALYIAPILKLVGLHKIHLDVRTPPVTVHGWKRRLDSIIFWHLSLKMFSSMVASQSFITQQMKEEVEQVSGRRFPDAHIWSSGASVSSFDLGPRAAVGKSSFEYFYHGTITTDRGILEMVRAFARVVRKASQAVSLKIVGAGPGIPALRELIDSEGLGAKISCIGLVPYEEIPALIHESDCCICPLPDRREWHMSSPLKVFEYMASGKPIVATPIDAHRNVLGSCDFVVWTQGYDEEALAAAMLEALEGYSKLAAEAEAAPAIVRDHYDWAKIGGDFAEFLGAQSR